MGATGDLLANNAAYAATFESGGLPVPPARRLVVLTCMDSRLEPVRALGLALGDAHVVRNAGGLATDDAIRSLVISQRMLGTEEIVLIHHTQCGLEGLEEEPLHRELERETGERPPFVFGAFSDVRESVRETARRLRASPFVNSSRLSGFVFDVRSGRLEEVRLD